MIIADIEGPVLAAIEQKKQEIGPNTQLSNTQIYDTCNAIASVLTSVNETHRYPSILKEPNH